MSVPIPYRAKAEAAVWLARLRADDRSGADERAFQAWLAADPAHAAAFEAVNTVWDVAGALPRDLRGSEPRREKSVHRRAIMAGVGALVAGGGSVAFWQAAQARVYQTDVGEQKHVSLRDGTEIFLDTDTRVEVDFSSARRVVDLKFGRANFRVAPDKERPFTVKVAQHLIVVSHSTFDVRRDGDRVSIVLIQGRALVQSGGSPEALAAGERLVASSAQNLRRDKPNMTPLLAWQTGQAIFENESLTAAVYEMNRYSTVKIEVADAAIANLKISGAYHVGDNEMFARSISQLLPVEIRQAENHIELIMDSARVRGE